LFFTFAWRSGGATVAIADIAFIVIAFLLFFGAAFTNNITLLSRRFAVLNCATVSSALFFGFI
jgi:hypothetical protein